ncbi:MAG: hypothetical protein V4850_20850 [Myxococcota bacterium]
MIAAWEVAAVVGGGLGAAGWAWARRKGWDQRERPWMGRWGLDVALIVAGLALNLPGLLGAWAMLSPFGSPMGPDADANFLAAVALERGDLALYAGDRYPAYAALVSALAPDASRLAQVGTWLSMGLAVACALGAYALGRALAGRVAGWAGLVVCLRLPGLADTGRQFTPYALVAAADLLAVLSLLALVRGHRVATIPLAVAAAVVFATDPKQVPVSLALVGLGIVVSLVRSRRSGIIECVPLVAALPLANALVGRAALPIYSLEFITTRVDLGLHVDAAMATTGWRIGTSLVDLPASLLAVSTMVQAPAGRGWFAPTALATLPMELPATSPLWLAALLVLPVVLHLRRRAAYELVALLPLVIVALPVLHLHFQHRYFLALVVVLPALVASAISLAAGPGAAAGVLIVALLWPGSPWRGVAPGVTAAPPPHAEPWTGVEPDEWARTVDEAATALPADAVVLDFAQSRPWVMLAASRPYVRCTTTTDNCRGALGDAPGTLTAVLFPGEEVSAAVPAASALATTGPVRYGPDALGACWTRVLMRPDNGGVYRWTCEKRPTQNAPPPRPQPGPAGPPGPPSGPPGPP